MRAIGWILGLMLWCCGVAFAAGKPAVTDARLAIEPELTRVVLNVSKETNFRVFTLVYLLQQAGGIASETDLIALYAYRT